jgi:uncharacterized protein with PIN domain
MEDGDTRCGYCNELFRLGDAERHTTYFCRDVYGQDPPEHRWQCPRCGKWLDDSQMEDLT